MALADEVVVENHDAGDGAEERGAANEPAEDVGTVTGHELPRHHEDADDTGDESTGAEGNEAGTKIGEIVRRGDNVGSNVSVECGDEERDKSNESNERLMEAAEEFFRQNGCVAADLRVVSARTPLPAFYRHLGYEETHRSALATDVKPKVPCEFIYMTKSLV